MKRVRDFFGYLLGGILFVALIPTIMWLASGMPDVWPVGIARAIGAAVLMLCGLVLSEERRLRRDFGEEYEEYCKHSRRF